MIKILKIFLPFFILAGIFLSIKLTSLAIRASDTNIYFYTAKEILAGKILYKDIFFTNFPLVPYVASFYFFLSKGNLLFYYFTASLEVVITAGLLFWISFKESKSTWMAATTSGIFLFSFILLATTQHQTGVFLATFFMTVSFLFFQKRRFTLTGVFTALALLAKAYTFPLLLAYLVVSMMEHRDKLLSFITGIIFAGGVVLLPSLLLAPLGLWHDVFEYSLTRSQGISKTGIFWFVIQHDLLFLVLLMTNIFLIKRNLFFGLFSLFGLLFFIFYKDTYYLYLVVLLPILALSFPYIVKEIHTRFHIHQLMLPTVLIPLLLYNLIAYYTGGYNTLQKLPDPQEMAAVIKQEKPAALYGVNSITPAMAYLSNTPMLNGIVDTNDNIFRKGYLEATQLTKDTIKQHALIITEGVWYPELGVTQDVRTEIVDQKELKKSCKHIKRFMFRSEGGTNAINFFRC